LAHARGNGTHTRHRHILFPLDIEPPTIRTILRTPPTPRELTIQPFSFPRLFPLFTPTHSNLYASVCLSIKSGVSEPSIQVKTECAPCMPCRCQMQPWCRWECGSRRCQGARFEGVHITAGVCSHATEGEGCGTNARHFVWRVRRADVASGQLQDVVNLSCNQLQCLVSFWYV
jgi:hypothetical protein